MGTVHTLILGVICSHRCCTSMGPLEANLESPRSTLCLPDRVPAVTGPPGERLQALLLFCECARQFKSYAGTTLQLSVLGK